MYVVLPSFVRHIYSPYIVINRSHNLWEDHCQYIMVQKILEAELAVLRVEVEGLRAEVKGLIN